MGLLDKLWDDIVAGPPPDNGLGKLRRSTTMPAGSSEDVQEAARRTAYRRSSTEFQRSNEEAPEVTRSITIVKPPYLRSLSVDTSDSPSSSSSSSPPASPSSLTPRERDSPWRSIHAGRNKAPRKKIPYEMYDKEEPRSPTVYDWVVISALDR